MYFGGLRAVDGMSLVVEPGQVHGLIGPERLRRASARRNGGSPLPGAARAASTACGHALGGEQQMLAISLG
jgi:ABC-type branched-subunit amino acid transport system ATPase component